MRILKLLGIMGRRYPLLLLGTVGVSLAMNVIDAASIISLGPIVDSLLHHELTEMSPLTQKVMGVVHALSLPPTTMTLLTLFVATATLKAVLQIATYFVIMKMKYAVINDVTVGLFRDVLNAKWSYFTSQRQGVLVNTVNREVGQVGDAFGAVATAISNSCHILILLLLPLYISWQVTLISAALGTLAALPFLVLGRYAYRLGKADLQASNEVVSLAQESVESAKTILSYGNQSRMLSALTSAFQRMIRSTLFAQTLRYSLPVIFYPLALLILVVTLNAADSFGVALSETAVLLYALLRILPMFGGMASAKNHVDAFFPAFEQIESLRAAAARAPQPSGSRPFIGLNDCIEVDGVCYAHTPDIPTVDHVSLKIRRGETVAFVGESGGGKTTLVDLILGLHEPDEGQIRIDGVPLFDFDMLSFRQRLGYVSQRGFLFNTTVRQNLLWARQDADEAALARACAAARAADFIAAMPKGLDTEVGDRGTRLSGGQIQRLVLAQALLRNPELLVLDEATSDLDAENERLIQMAIEELGQTRTVIMVAHRLSTVRRADCIHVMQNGRIVESGTYESLLAAKGCFWQLATAQRSNAGKAERAAPQLQPSI